MMLSYWIGRKGGEEGMSEKLKNRMENIMIIILRMGFEELTDGKLNPVWHKHPELEDSQDEHSTRAGSQLC